MTNLREGQRHMIMQNEHRNAMVKLDQLFRSAEFYHAMETTKIVLRDLV
jgi:hypothetical protein